MDKCTAKEHVKKILPTQKRKEKTCINAANVS